MSLAAMQIQNLLYLIGALAVATLWISALYLLRHRKPRSLEAGIESFSRELRALAPDRRPQGGEMSNDRGRPRSIRGSAAGTETPAPGPAKDDRAETREDE
jgi:hypothetical protein